jgi:hypothetical protein
MYPLDPTYPYPPGWIPFIGTIGGAAPTPIPFPDGWYVEPVGINNSGQIVGWGYSTGFSHIFVGTASGLAPLPIPAGMVGAGALGVYISSAGVVAGTGSSGVTTLPFIGTATGIASVALPSGWVYASVMGVSDLGQIVGIASLSNPFYPFPFVGSASGLTNLNDFMPKGWRLYGVSRINNAGQIATAGWDPNGIFRIVRLDP